MKFPVVVVSYRHSRCETDRWNDPLFCLPAAFSVRKVDDYKSLVALIAELDCRAYNKEPTYIRRENTDYYYNHHIIDDTTLLFDTTDDGYADNGVIRFPESWSWCELNECLISVGAVRLRLSEETYRQEVEKARLIKEAAEKREREETERKRQIDEWKERQDYERLKAKYEGNPCTPHPESSNTGQTIT